MLTLSTMQEERTVVRVVADEFGDHLPVWFPSPIFDDDAQMPISSELVSEFRHWNALGNDRGRASSSEIAEHYRVGLELARKLADELGPTYVVQFLMAGERGGWQTVEG